MNAFHFYRDTSHETYQLVKIACEIITVTVGCCGSVAVWNFYTFFPFEMSWFHPIDQSTDLDSHFLF